MRGALIPMKDLAGAKMRLAGVLDREARSELALAMLTDVITACRESACFDLIAVVSSDSEVFWHARELGAKPLAEPATLSGLNDGLTFAQRYMARRVAVAELTILPADIPLVRADDIRGVVEALGDAGARAVIVRARDNGTNALAMRPPEALPMRFGVDSAEAHIAAAAQAQVEIVELTNERLAFDVDAPEDLAALPGLPLGAATAGWLEARAHYAAQAR
ncbi:MAG: 2-phospho-L-lactate guanylyltransferase [Dehalococcoidia bacterium]